MDLQAKATHNYLPYLVKTDENTPFHSTIDIILQSKYLTILTADAPIYLDTLQEFWLNAEFLLQEKSLLPLSQKLERQVSSLPLNSYPQPSHLMTCQVKTLSLKQSFTQSFRKGGMMLR